MSDRNPNPADYPFGEVIAIHYALGEEVWENIPRQADNQSDEDYDPTPDFAVNAHGHTYRTLPEAVAALAMVKMGMNLNRVWAALDALRGMADA